MSWENNDGRYTAFFNALKEIYQIHLEKSINYGKESDPYANIRSSEEWGVEAWKATLVRQGDKQRRLQNAAKGVPLTHESIRDSLIDNATYAVIALVLYDEMKKEN